MEDVRESRFFNFPTEEDGTQMLVRVVDDNRKGEIEKSVVPKKLRVLTLKFHHEWFGHMGSNRMLETMRLRYYWRGFEKDIIDTAIEIKKHFC